MQCGIKPCWLNEKAVWVKPVAVVKFKSYTLQAKGWAEPSKYVNRCQVSVIE